MSKKLKNISRNAEKGITLRWGDVWEAYIDLPKHGGSIAVCSTNKDEAVKIRQIILDALHAHAHGKEEDPEAWRERNRQRQAAGVKFEKKFLDGSWRFGEWDFVEKKEDYREVQEDPIDIWNRNLASAKPLDNNFNHSLSISHIESRILWRQGYKGSIFTFDIGGEEHYREVPQESNADIFNKHFQEALRQTPPRMEKMLPEKTKEYEERIIKLQPTIPHAAERALWKAQREAGTNEVWQQDSAVSFNVWHDIPVNQEPAWLPEFKYRPKPNPAKLTAKIIRKSKWPTNTTVQDWEFYGTPDEYRAECAKYGYAVVSEIKKVVKKPKTVKCYVVAIKASNTGGKEDVKNFLSAHGVTIIGDIEDREVPIE